MIHDNAWTTYTAAELKNVEKLSKDYIDFINNGKTERECTEIFAKNFFLICKCVRKQSQKCR